MSVDQPGLNGPTRRPRRSTAERLRSEILTLCRERARVLRHKECSWASVTFAGTRHEIELHFAGSEALDAGEALLTLLPDHEFTLPGQLVADAAIVEVEHRLHPEPSLRLRCELLLLDEC